MFLAFADKYGIDEETALRLSCSFGGGMSRIRTVCGAVSGMALVCGMETGNTDCTDQKAKTDNYARMRGLAGEFENRTGASSAENCWGSTKTREGPRARRLQPVLRSITKSVPAKK